MWVATNMGLCCINLKEKTHDFYTPRKNDKRAIPNQDIFDLLLDDEVVLFDTVDKAVQEIFFENIEFLLKDNENVVTVFICAPQEEKINRGITYYGLEPNKAASIINKKNKKRRSYYNFYTDKDWGNPSSYDLCINSKNGIETAVEAICAYTKRRFGLE